MVQEKGGSGRRVQEDALRGLVGNNVALVNVFKKGGVVEVCKVGKCVQLAIFRVLHYRHRRHRQRGLEHCLLSASLSVCKGYDISCLIVIQAHSFFAGYVVGFEEIP